MTLSKPARNAEIARLYLEGKHTQVQIGDMFGISGAAVSTIVRKQGLRIDKGERISQWLRRNWRAGKLGRFAGLINSEHDQAGEPSNRNSAPAGQPVCSFHNRTNSAGGL